MRLARRGSEGIGHGQGIGLGYGNRAANGRGS